MADTKISALTAASALGGAEAFPAVQGGATVRVSPAQLAAFARANAVEAVAFSTTPPLDGRKAMGQQVISAPLSFAAPASPVAGASCYVRLIADGTNVPAFPAASFVEHGSSAGFLNLAGAVNLVEFWFDGIVIYYAINQAANVSPFAASSAYVPNAGPASVVLTYPYTLNAGSVPPGSAFAITASGGAATVSNVAISGRSVTLTLSRAVAGGETVSILYTPPGSAMLLDMNGNAVLTSSIAAINGVPAAGSQYLRFANSQQNVTETADPIGGYDYAPTAAALGYAGSAGRAISAAAIPAGQDGFVIFPIQGSAVANGVMLGLQTATTLTAFSSITFGIYSVSASAYTAITGGGTGSANGTALMYQTGDLIRLRRANTSGTPVAYAELSRDNGATWTVLHSWTTGVSTAALYPCFFGTAQALGTAGLIMRALGSANVA